jgi:hypothetical protein
MSNYKAYLRKQPNFDEITGYIYFGQDRIRYPDRSASILRSSPYLGLYDGIGTHELEEQEEQVEKANTDDEDSRLKALGVICNISSSELTGSLKSLVII